MATTSNIPIVHERSQISLPPRTPAPRTRDRKPAARHEQLNTDVLLLHPLENDRSGRNRAPHLIILFGYMDAPTKSLTSNYTDAYHKLYPTATIVVVKMKSTFFFISLKEKERVLKPVEDILLREVYEADPRGGRRGGLLIHILSNGGGFQFMTFAAMVERTLASPRPRSHTIAAATSAEPLQQAHSLPLALIFDSVPGSTEYASVHSFTITIRNPLLRALAQLPMVFVLTATLLVYRLVGTPMPFGALRSRLARADVFPGSSAGTRRLYIYGTGDTQVPWDAVERHLNELRATLTTSATAAVEHGNATLEEVWNNVVRVEKFSGSRHVGHVKEDPTRYWSAVSAVWDAALEKAVVEREVEAKM